MNSVRCPNCGFPQIVALETRPNNVIYDTEQLGIKDLPHERDKVYTGAVGWNGRYAIARCLNEECRVSYLVEKHYRDDPWKVQALVPCTGTIGEGVPALVDEAYRQATMCLAIGCPDASIAMCRAALDRMTKEKGAKDNTLKARLAHLVQQEILKKSVITEAINVKDFGNTALHDLLTQEITKEDAEIICEFTKGVLYDVYVTPELARKAEERRKRLTTKK